MAFIVEMSWITPPQHGEREPGWRSFSCSVWVWEQALELGRKAGWRPLNTIPSESSHEAWTRHGQFDSSYEPNEWQYCKQFQSVDAAALADSLQKVLDSRTPLPLRKGPSLISDGMTDEGFIAANRGVSERFLREFIAFLRQGPFDFAYDDRESALYGH